MRARFGITAPAALLILASCAAAPKYRPGYTPRPDRTAAAEPTAEPRTPDRPPPEPTRRGRVPAGPERWGDHALRGMSSWYGQDFHGRRTANGEVFDMYKLTAAHRTLPLGTRARIWNVENGLSCVVTINDRGPFIEGRILDLSYAAALELQFAAKGLALVQIEILELPPRPWLEPIIVPRTPWLELRRPGSGGWTCTPAPPGIP